VSSTSYSFAPAPIVCVFEFNGDGAVGIHRLFACPSHRFDCARANLKLGGKIELARVPLGKQKRRLPQPARMGMPWIESSSQAQFLVGTLEL